MDTREYDDIWALLDNMAAHTRETGDVVLPGDIPPKIGFFSVPAEEKAEGVQWYISLSRFSESLKAETDYRSRIILQCFTSAAGRQMLCRSFPGQRTTGPGTEGLPSLWEQA